MKPAALGAILAATLVLAGCSTQNRDAGSSADVQPAATPAYAAYLGVPRRLTERGATLALTLNKVGAMAGVSGEVALDLTVKNVGRRSWDLREDDIWAAYADTPTAWTHDQDSNIVGLDLTFGSARTSPALAHDLHLAPGQNKRVSLAIEAGSAGDRVLIYFGSGAGDPAAEWRVTVR